MDGDRFDAITRSLIAFPSRRATRRLLTGGGGAAPLSVLGRRAAAVVCVPITGDPDLGFCGGGATCCDGSRCVDDRCRCRAGLTPCPVGARPGEYCRDLRADRRHCGRCGRVCPPGTACARCRGDGCATKLPARCCPHGFTNCGGACKDLQTDITNCHRCGHVCSPDHECCDGFCRNLLNHPDHCGACFNPCDSGHVCSGGGCVPVGTCLIGQDFCTQTTAACNSATGCACVRTDRGDSFCADVTDHRCAACLTNEDCRGLPGMPPTAICALSTDPACCPASTTLCLRGPCLSPP